MGLIHCTMHLCTACNSFTMWHTEVSVHWLTHSGEWWHWFRHLEPTCTKENLEPKTFVLWIPSQFEFIAWLMTFFTRASPLLVTPRMAQYSFLYLILFFMGTWLQLLSWFYFPYFMSPICWWGTRSLLLSLELNSAKQILFYAF